MLKSLLSNRLQGKLLSLVFVASLPAFALLFWVGVDDREGAIQTANAELAGIAHLVALDQEKQIEGVRQTVKLLSRLRELRGGSAKVCASQVEDLRAQTNLFNIGVINIDGTLRCGALSANSTANVADQPWFRRALGSRQFSASGYISSRVPGRQILIFAVPIDDLSDELTGVVFASWELSAHEKSLSDLRLARGARLTLVDPSGMVLGSYPANPDSIGKLVADARVLDAIRAGTVGERNGDDASGAAVLRAIDAVRAGDTVAMYTVVSTDRDNVVSPINRAAYLNLAVWLATLALAMATAWRFGRRWISARAATVSFVAREIGSGKLGARTGFTTSADELDQIGQAIDLMALALERRDTDLRITNRRLREAQRIAKLGHWEFDVASQRGWRSPETSEMFAIAADDSFDAFLEWVHADDRERVAAAFTRILADGTAIDIEHRAVGLDGERRWIHAVGECIFDAGGHLVKLAGVIQDITERKKIEASLKLLEAAVNRANDMIIISEPESADEPEPRILFVNHAFETHTGYRSEEVLGRSPRLLQGPDSNREALDRVHNARATWSPIREELINYTKEGKPFWVELDLAPIADESGRFTQWVSIERDIGERKAAAATLIASEENYRQIFLRNPLPLWVYDPQTLQFLDVNDAACTNYGYSREEMLTMNLRDVRPPADIPALEQRLPRDGATVTRSGPWRHLRKDGTSIMVETSNHEVLFNARRARLVCPFDVTERTYAQEEIRRLNLLLERKVAMRTEDLSRSLALQQSLFDNVPQIVWLADVNGAITFVNRIWSEHIGVAGNDWEGERWSDSLHPADTERVMREWRAAAPNADKFAIEFRLLQREGGYHDYQVGARKTFSPNGEPICWVGICSDVSDIREREDALRIANQELDAFSSSVSHDLRAPLRIIAGFSERLQRDAADRLDAQGRHCLERIRAGAENMNGLIDDLLSLSRLTQADMMTGKVDLTRLAREVFEELRQHHPDQPVEIAIAENMTAIGDTGLLRVALVNLIGNALKFSSKRPLSRIVIGEHVLPGDTSTFFVRDNGAGFDPAYAGKMFGVFQRLHSAKEFPGTGIGLANVQRIIHRHGGRIGAEGAVDAGATFSFTLRRE